MAKSHWAIPMLRDAERASKRQTFDPASVTRKPKHPWLDIGVGEDFKVHIEDITRAGIDGGANRWTRQTGRVFSINKVGNYYVVTRTA